MWLSVCVFGFIVAFSTGQILSSKEQMHRLAYANNNFAINLHRKLVEEGERNVFFSPFSISSVLTMIYKGASGGTADELRKLLRYTKFKDSTIFSAFQYYLSEVIDKIDPKQYTIRCLSALITDKSFPVLPKYKTAVRDIFQAFVEDINMAEESALVVDRMNTWAKIKSKGDIPILVEEIDPETKIFLGTAAYFKGTWKIQFDPENTKNHSFYNAGDRSNVSQVPMMHVHEQMRYFEDEDEDFSAVELLYEGRNVSMLICLPNRYNGLEQLEKNMTATKMQHVRRTTFFTKTHLTLPTFKMQTEYSLSGTLRELGFKRLFQVGADLSDMLSDGSNLLLDEIKHKAAIEVNEQGSVASAITRALMMKSMPHTIPDPEFKVNHPFLFALFDIRNSLVLFMGRVTHFPVIQ